MESENQKALSDCAKLLDKCTATTRKIGDAKILLKNDITDLIDRIRYCIDYMTMVKNDCEAQQLKKLIDEVLSMVEYLHRPPKFKQEFFGSNKTSMMIYCASGKLSFCTVSFNRV